jgi:hypothetical protein
MMPKKAGRVAKLYLSEDGGSTYTEVECTRDMTMGLEKAELTSTSRGDGDWESYIQGRKSGTIEVNQLWNEDNAQLLAIVDAYYNDTELDFRWVFEAGVGKPQYDASCFVMSLSKGAPNDDVSTVDYTLRINGAVTPGTQT